MTSTSLIRNLFTTKNNCQNYNNPKNKTHHGTLPNTPNTSMTKYHKDHLFHSNPIDL